jgi:2-polyprenyl-3-methyl-5-hydroxy-6-metoxy-1,4-benzoquinol methylase
MQVSCGLSHEEPQVILLYRHSDLPNNPELVKRIATAASSLYEKLATLNLDRLDLSDYNRAYLRRYQRKLRTNLQKYAYVLAWGLAQNSRPLGHAVLLEYGGGSGILSLLAKECGIGTVIYSDIYDVSCVDAETIGQATGNTADHYVCGDIDDVAEFMSRNSISCDIMVSSDVIEHIYNIEEFFARLPDLSDGRLSIALSTHANPHNPFVRRLLANKQAQVECEDREYTPGHKKRDSLRSYLSIRRDIVRECGDGLLSSDEVEKLARVTRGMIDADIRSSVFAYIESKELPAPIDHATNTCDPYTGNWADRLADPHELMRGLAKAGFDAAILAGRYGTPNGRIKQMLAKILDFLITLVRHQNLRLAPFFLLHGSGDFSIQRQPEMAHFAEAPEKAPQPTAS